MTIQSDAILLVDWLERDWFNKPCIDDDIAAHFGWGRGKKFHLRLSKARDVAHERGLGLSFDLLIKRDGRWHHAVELTETDTLALAASLPPVMSNVASRSARASRLSEHIEEYASSPTDRLMAGLARTATDALSAVLSKTTEVYRYMAEQREAFKDREAG